MLLIIFILIKYNRMQMVVLQLLQKLQTQAQIEMLFQDGIISGVGHFTTHLFLVIGIDHLDFILGQDLAGV
jgi:hypothetical protein